MIKLFLVATLAENGQICNNNLHVGFLLNEEKAKNNKSGFTDNLPKNNNMEGNLRSNSSLNTRPFIYLETTAFTSEIPIST